MLRYNKSLFTFVCTLSGYILQLFYDFDVSDNLPVCSYSAFVTKKIVRLWNRYDEQLQRFMTSLWMLRSSHGLCSLLLRDPPLQHVAHPLCYVIYKQVSQHSTFIHYQYNRILQLFCYFYFWDRFIGRVSVCVTASNEVVGSIPNILQIILCEFILV